MNHGAKENNNNGGSIISIKVIPSSINHRNMAQLDCNSTESLEIPTDLKDGQRIDITYTYSVKFIQNNEIKWPSRWDYILDTMPHTNIQWFSIFNSMVVIVLLCGIVSFIIIVKLRKDIYRYNQIEWNDETNQKFGWILVREHVFRSPHMSMLLAALLGAGVQLLFVAFVALALAGLGLLSPTNRGALMTCTIYLYILFGTIAGFVSAIMYKNFGGIEWKHIALLASILSPGYILIIYV